MSTQTVPHILFIQISSVPSYSVFPPTSLTAPSEQSLKVTSSFISAYTHVKEERYGGRERERGKRGNRREEKVTINKMLVLASFACSVTDTIALV